MGQTGALEISVFILPGSLSVAPPSGRSRVRWAPECTWPHSVSPTPSPHGSAIWSFRGTSVLEHHHTPGPKLALALVCSGFWSSSSRLAWCCGESSLGSDLGPPGHLAAGWMSSGILAFDTGARYQGSGAAGTAFHKRGGFRDMAVPPRSSADHRSDIKPCVGSAF